jgi:hypothetical protein
MQQVEQGALAAVEAAVRNVTTLAEEPQQSSKEPADFGKLGGDAVLKYSEAAAVHIEQVGREILEDAQRKFSDCQRLADDIRGAAEAHAIAINAHTARSRMAATGMTDIRDTFRADQVREHEEAERKRLAATSAK